jgi:hypothetical protein
MNTNSMEAMATSSEILGKLWRNNVAELRFNGQGLSSYANVKFAAQDLRILRIYRFEGASNPSDEEIIYLIRTSDGTLGYFQLAFGPYAEQPESLANFLLQIPESDREAQIPFEL